jgi:hypothetical protein
MRSSVLRLGALAALLLAVAARGIAAQPLPRRADPPFPAWSQNAPPDSARESLSLGARLLTATGAAAVGAGLGFFASQLARGDWEDGPGGRPIDRPLWAAIGGGVGFAVGFRFPLARMGKPATKSRLPSGRDRLGADEILRAKVVNAFEAVRLLRPEWLVLRGNQTWNVPSDRVPGNAGPLRIYLQSQLLGGVESLRSIAAQDIAAIYFLDAGEATHRWGAGHPQGAVLVVMAG